MRVKVVIIQQVIQKQKIMYNCKKNTYLQFKNYIKLKNIYNTYKPCQHQYYT